MELIYSLFKKWKKKTFLRQHPNCRCTYKRGKVPFSVSFSIVVFSFQKSKDYLQHPLQNYSSFTHLRPLLTGAYSFFLLCSKSLFMFLCALLISAKKNGVDATKNVSIRESPDVHKSLMKAWMTNGYWQ